MSDVSLFTDVQVAEQSTVMDLSAAEVGSVNEWIVSPCYCINGLNGWMDGLTSYHLIASLAHITQSGGRQGQSQTWS